MACLANQTNSAGAFGCQLSTANKLEKELRPRKVARFVHQTTRKSNEVKTVKAVVNCAAAFGFSSQNLSNFLFVLFYITNKILE